MVVFLDDKEKYDNPKVLEKVEKQVKHGAILRFSILLHTSPFYTDFSNHRVKQKTV